MQKIDYFLSLLGDGAWHNLKELARHSRIPKQRLETLFKLLSETNIVEYETQKDQVKIKREWQQILKDADKEQQIGKSAIGSIVIPSKKSVTLQGIRVTNLTEKDLEISMRVNEKLEELAISIVG